MFGKMKYVRFTCEFGENCFIVFSNHMNHAQTVKAIRHTEVISAGFVFFSEGAVICHGRSESLDICSRTEDSDMLTKQIEGC
jgi:hypothetical protein